VCLKPHFITAHSVPLQIVFAGLDIIVPLLSPELLKFPKLCRAYFALLAHMLEVSSFILISHHLLGIYHSS